MKKILCMKRITVFSNEYGTLYNDEVEGPSGINGNYLRWRWKNRGIIVVPVFKDKFALAQMYRYPPAIFSLEFPSGGINHNETIKEAAIRELYEEFGLVTNQVIVLGKIYPDTGILADAINVVVANLKTDQTLKTDFQEAMESINKEIVWKSFLEFKKDIVSGKIRAGTTVSSAMLYLSWVNL